MQGMWQSPVVRPYIHAGVISYIYCKQSWTPLHELEPGNRQDYRDVELSKTTAISLLASYINFIPTSWLFEPPESSSFWPCDSSCEISRGKPSRFVENLSYQQKFSPDNFCRLQYTYVTISIPIYVTNN